MSPPIAAMTRAMVVSATARFTFPPNMAGRFSHLLIRRSTDSESEANGPRPVLETVGFTVPVQVYVPTTAGAVVLKLGNSNSIGCVIK